MEGKRENNSCFPDVQLLIMDFLFKELERVSSSSSTDSTQEPVPAGEGRIITPIAQCSSGGKPWLTAVQLPVWRFTGKLLPQRVDLIKGH